MENWRKDGRKDAMIVEMDALVPKNHLLRKVERVMDYVWGRSQWRKMMAMMKAKALGAEEEQRNRRFQPQILKAVCL